MARKKRSAACLLGQRITLRSLVSADFEQWKKVREANQTWLVPWEPTKDPKLDDPSFKRGAFASRCDSWERERENGRGHQFGIFKNPTQFIGEVNISAIQRGVFQSCSVGYWIDEREAGNGYIPEAVAMVMQYAFEELGLHRVQIAIVPTNKPSLRVVEKLNLRKEGLAERYLEINGTWEDHYIFAMTSEEYLKNRHP